MYDWAFNYKTQDVKMALNIAAPKGVSILLIFFDYSPGQ